MSDERQLELGAVDWQAMRARRRLEELELRKKARGLEAGYRRDYSRGWVASNRSEGSDCLEGADTRGEPASWYDGYLDAAAGRLKWHIPLCPNHHPGPDGCGES